VHVGLRQSESSAFGLGVERATRPIPSHRADLVSGEHSDRSYVQASKRSQACLSRGRRWKAIVPPAPSHLDARKPVCFRFGRIGGINPHEGANRFCNLGL
jgi:hypothetical protein